jgi:hypothetical protein
VADIIPQRKVNQIFSHIPARTLREWALNGFYEWVGETEDARGTQRSFSKLNLYQIGLTEVLARNNFVAKDILEIMDDLFKKDNRFKGVNVIDYFTDQFLLIVKDNKKIKDKTLLNEKELSVDFLSPISFSIITTVINLNLIKNKVDNLVNKIGL